MKPIIDREQLFTLLARWEEGLLNEKQVQEFAESFTDDSDVPELPHDDDESIVNEVLLHLDALPALLITKRDIPAIVTFLLTPPGSAREGWSAWLTYWKDLDEAKRREELQTNPFYFT